MPVSSINTRARAFEIYGQNIYPSFLGKTAESDFWNRHVCPSVRMEQLGSKWTDFHEI